MNGISKRHVLPLDMRGDFRHFAGPRASKARKLARKAI